MSSHADDEILLPLGGPTSLDAPRTREPSGPMEPTSMLDFEETPERYHIDDCGLLFKDPNWAFVYWEVTEHGIEEARRQLGPSAASSHLVLRLFSTWDGQHSVERSVVDHDLHGWTIGRRYLQVAHPGAQLRAAIGMLSAEGYFAPIAHSPLVRVPPDGPSRTIGTKWMTVVPSRSRGREREPLERLDRAGYSERGERALGFSTRARGSVTSPTRIPQSGQGT
jgi:hypothetical protein